MRRGDRIRQRVCAVVPCRQSEIFVHSNHEDFLACRCLRMPLIRYPMRQAHEQQKWFSSANAWRTVSCLISPWRTGCFCQRLRKSAADRIATLPPSSTPSNQKTQLYKRSAVKFSVLCEPSMGAIQRRFKSSVYRMNIEEQKKLLAMKSTTSLSSVASGEGGRPTA